MRFEGIFWKNVTLHTFVAINYADVSLGHACTNKHLQGLVAFGLESVIDFRIETIE